MKVCILGAGPCGLTAGWELAKNGVAVTVVEKDSTVGGLCKTTGKNGYRFDLGGHRFISKDERLVNSVKLLMGSELLTRRRKSVIRFKNRQYDYPLNFRNVMGQSSAWMNFRFAVGYVASACGVSRSSAPEGSFEHWVDTRFGKPLNDFFFKPYSEKLWGVKTSEISGDWAAQRISLLNAKDALMKMMKPSGEKTRTYASHYLYPKKGIGAIFDSMAEDIKRMGGEIITSAQPTGFEADGKRISKVFLKNDNGDSYSLKADVFLSTIPLEELAYLLHWGGRKASPLPYRSLRFLNIMLNRQNFSPNTWMYVPEKEMIMTRIQEPKQRSPFNAPDGKTSVMLEIPCDEGDSIWNMPDEKLLGKALGDLQKLGFDIKDDVTGCFSTRALHAYPRYEMDYKKKVEKLRGMARLYDNLSSLGRQGLFRYIFMDTAMLMGRGWAENILGKNGEQRMDDIDSEKKLLETMSIIY